ncbi:MAG: M28 family peptidase [Chlorobi bacterium]|nr:M28 family peptidase [Chlorobiota bacterium]
MKTKPARILSKYLFILLLTGTTAMSILVSGHRLPGRDDPGLHYAYRLSMDSLMYLINLLASDSLEGRETGTDGELKAARLLARWHEDNGVPPGRHEYIQEFQVVKPGIPDAYIYTDMDTFRVGKDFLSLFPHDSAFFFDDHIVYVGYGISDPSWNDYAYYDVRGKIVLAKEGEPKDNFGVNILTATDRPSEWSADPIHAYIRKRNVAMQHGAKAFLYYAPRTYALFRDIYHRIYENTDRTVTIEPDTLYDFIINDRVLEGLTGYDNLNGVYYEGPRDRKWPVPVAVEFGSKTVSYPARNVLARVDGDLKADEVILVIANFDHLGKENDSVWYPGANNNASGTAALAEIAKMFQIAREEGHPPARTVYFVHSGGREKNHIGAKYFFERMPFARHKLKAVVDLDMLGYRDTLLQNPYSLYLAVSYPNKRVMKKLDEANRLGPALELVRINPVKAYQDPVLSTDGIVFYSRGFPVYFLSNGPSYPFNRTPKDTPDKIDGDLYTQRVRFAFLTAWILANE